MTKLSDEGIFTVKARRCKRCGGLLTSEQAVREGYGHVCKIKSERERKALLPDPDQLSLFEEDYQNGK